MTNRNRRSRTDFDDRSIKRRRQRQARRKKARIRNIASLILIIAIIITTGHKIATSPRRNVSRLSKAIKADDEKFLNNKTDKLGNILTTLKKSYSDDEKKQEEFVDAFFKNLDISYVDSKKEEDVVRVDLKVTSVNYVKVYEKLKDKNHDAYIKALEDEDVEKKESDTSIYLKNSLFSSKILESRDFVNSILGKALDELER